jgi:hypothetical protein
MIGIAIALNYCGGMTRYLVELGDNQYLSSRLNFQPLQTENAVEFDATHGIRITPFKPFSCP